MKIFGTTRYVRVGDNYPYTDVQPFEPYLQLEVKNMWDWNPQGFHLEYDGEFTYYVKLYSKENDNTYHFSKYLKTEELTEEHKQLIKEYFGRD